MRAIFLILFLYVFSIHAQVANPLPHHTNKRLLIAHPTKGTIEVIYALHKNRLVDYSHIQLTGIFHKNETYDYTLSEEMLDSMPYLNMDFIELKDTLMPDKLFMKNACTHIFKELFESSSGILLFGGPDIPPSIYGEEPHPRTKVTDPFRHYFEASFIYHILGGNQNSKYTGMIDRKPDYLILGFCLGMQTINVATGGTLIQDIPHEIFNSDETSGLEHLDQEQIHRNFYTHMIDHKNSGLSGSTFHHIKFTNTVFPDQIDIEEQLTPLVNSYHHQAVEKVGQGFQVSATSSDGKIIEAIHHVKHPNVFAVQFHPERSQFYLGTKRFQYKPNGESRLLSEWLDQESMDFHLNFWKALDRILQNME